MAFQVEITDGPIVTIESFDDVQKFVDNEKNKWSLLLGDSLEGVAAYVRRRILDDYDYIISQARAAYHYGNGEAYASNAISNKYADGGALSHSKSEIYKSLLISKDDSGVESALIYYGLLKQIVDLSQFKSINDVKSLIYSIVPEVKSSGQMYDRLKSERISYKSNLSKSIKSTEEALTKFQNLWDDLVELSSKRSLDFAKKKSLEWRELKKNIAIENDELSSSIKAVEDNYKNAMTLLAPVEYWINKSVKHHDDGAKALYWLKWYFPLAILIVTLLFLSCSWFILDRGNEGIPNGFFFIASAGLASVVGLFLWVGRLLTKLYLSEHHLKRDAEERAVMTKTFLALNGEEAASEADRAIILQALFRSSSDGIVREEGALDPSLPAMMAKMLAR